MMISNKIDNGLDYLFDSDNDYDIPSLRLDWQANGLVLPAEVWGSIPRSRIMTGTYLLYNYDDFLNPLWNDPTKLLVSGCNNVVEINFSMTKDMPLAVGIYQLYRKRWLSRFWAEHCGIKLFVDLNVAEKWQQINLLGVPKGWSHYFTQGYMDFGTELLKTQLELAKIHAGKEDIAFVVYSGGKEIKEWCKNNKAIYVERWINRGNGKEPVKQEVEMTVVGNKKGFFNLQKPNEEGQLILRRRKEA